MQKRFRHDCKPSLFLPIQSKAILIPQIFLSDFSNPFSDSSNLFVHLLKSFFSDSSNLFVRFLKSFFPIPQIFLLKSFCPSDNIILHKTKTFLISKKIRELLFFSLQNDTVVAFFETQLRSSSIKCAKRSQRFFRLNKDHIRLNLHS